MDPMNDDDDPDTLLGVQRDADDLSEWCGTCQRNHQRRERAVQCRGRGCSTMTDNYHGLCPKHR